MASPATSPPCARHARGRLQRGGLVARAARDRAEDNEHDPARVRRSAAEEAVQLRPLFLARDRERIWTRWARRRDFLADERRPGPVRVPCVRCDSVPASEPPQLLTDAPEPRPVPACRDAQGRGPRDRRMSDEHGRGSSAQLRYGTHYHPPVAGPASTSAHAVPTACDSRPATLQVPLGAPSSTTGSFRPLAHIAPFLLVSVAAPHGASFRQDVLLF